MHVDLALWDTSGMDGSERTRSIAYPGSDVIMICFGIDSPDSLDNVQEKVPNLTYFTYSNTTKKYRS